MRSHDHDDIANTRDARRSSRERARPHRESKGQPGGPLGAASIVGLQRSVGNAAVARLVGDQPSPVFDVIGRGGGRPLEPRVREAMEDHLGSPLGRVRVHVDARSTESVQAKAYTAGEDIVVHPRHYDPSSQSGRRLLAHEAVHVHQQRSGPVAGTPVGGGISLSDPSDRFERAAEAAACDVSARL